MVTQAEAINTAMIGHQISPLSQQIIAVSVVCSGGGEKNQFHCPKACNKAPSARASCFFSGTRGRSGQTCNFWNSLPAAYFFLCQLLAAGSACGPRDLTKVACGAKTGQRSALNVLPKKTTVGKETVSVAIWRAERTGRLIHAGGAAAQEKCQALADFRDAVPSRFGRIGPNIDSIDTNAGIGAIGSMFGFNVLLSSVCSHLNCVKLFYWKRKNIKHLLWKMA